VLGEVIGQRWRAHACDEESGGIVKTCGSGSFSAQGDCLEWEVGPSSVRLRHSKNPTGPELVFIHSEWAAFVAGIKHGEADLYPNQDDSGTEV
jgi:Domain of unknown function (DUF397)